ncbi:MAG TPA: hypothetical protein VGF59_05575 [Bryobacteraceae bacterium]|jgi:hypothetical protein
MGFLGVISLAGMIVSHIIVLFDFIEEKHAEGEPFEQAVLDAGITLLARAGVLRDLRARPEDRQMGDGRAGGTAGDAGGAASVPKLRRQIGVNL